MQLESAAPNTSSKLQQRIEPNVGLRSVFRGGIVLMAPLPLDSAFS